MSTSAAMPGPVLDGVLGHHGGVVARAAGDDEHLVDPAARSASARCRISSRTRVPSGRRRSSRVSATARGCSRISLLMKSVVARLLRGGEVPVDAQGRRLDLARRRGWSPAPTRAAARPAGRRPGRTSGRSGRAAPGCPRPGGRRPSVSPRTRGVFRRAATTSSGSSACTTATRTSPDTGEGCPHRLGQAEPGGHLLLDQVGQHLGVGVRDEDVAGGRQARRPARGGSR